MDGRCGRPPAHLLVVEICMEMTTTTKMFLLLLSYPLIRWEKIIIPCRNDRVHTFRV